MRKKLLISFIIFDFLCGIGAVALSNTNITAVSVIREGREKMFELGSVHEDLETRYLKLALEHVEPQARKAGFVAVIDPHYIRSDTVVGFLTR